LFAKPSLLEKYPSGHNTQKKTFLGFSYMVITYPPTLPTGTEPSHRIPLTVFNFNFHAVDRQIMIYFIHHRLDHYIFPVQYF
jgi:hypothetical protein